MRDDVLVSASILGARQAPDACGGRELLDHIVPDGPFLEACRFHDACYRSGALDQGCSRGDGAHYTGAKWAAMHLQFVYNAIAALGIPTL